MATLLHQTNEYACHTMRGGVLQITRKRDGAFLVFVGKEVRDISWMLNHAAKIADDEERESQYKLECDDLFADYAEYLNTP